VRGEREKEGKKDGCSGVFSVPFPEWKKKGGKKKKKKGSRGNKRKGKKKKEGKKKGEHDDGPCWPIGKKIAYRGGEGGGKKKV